MENTLKAITIEELKKVKTQIIQISDFSGEGTFNVEVRRPSLLTLATSGNIPNELIGDVNDLFFGKKEEKDIEMAKLKEIYDGIVKATLVSPTFEELKENDIQLTEVQVGELYKYVVGGVKELKYFREIQNSTKTAQYEQILQKIAELNSKD
jgi:hypothetical protein|uniref:Uncharacterized protein n=1 Tax=Myoviridae sp. ctfyA6 TaxID=2827698 RepID=A0A8S5SSM6_9CAUD|nr:MAG TPA: hypothetical protein [Myoviridae sp. ctfyA6]